MNFQLFIVQIIFCYIVFSLGAANLVPHGALSEKDRTWTQRSSNTVASVAKNAVSENSQLRTGNRNIDECMDLLAESSERKFSLWPQRRAELLEICKLQSEILRSSALRVRGTSSQSGVLHEKELNDVERQLFPSFPPCQERDRLCLSRRAKELKCLLAILETVLSRQYARMPEMSRVWLRGSSSAYIKPALEGISSVKSAKTETNVCQGVPGRVRRSFKSLIRGRSRRVLMFIISRLRPFFHWAKKSSFYCLS